MKNRLSEIELLNEFLMQDMREMQADARSAPPVENGVREIRDSSV